MNQIKLFSFFIILFLLVYLFYLPQDILDIDSTQYAEITREMIQNNEYLKIRDNGRKYLDKPIMTFWILSISFKLFGINNFAYRFPAYVMAIISIVAIYKLTFLLYKDRRVALFASLLYLSSPALFTMLTSPIIDIYLTTFVILIFTFYYYGIYWDHKYFYLMYIFIGIGFITKGPISLVLPIVAIGGNILFTRNWELLKKLKIIQGMVIVLIPVSFWCYWLYIDFGIYGPYFFLFLQSFGRFFSKIYDTGWDPFYFYFTFLYSILHISVPFLVILFDKRKVYFRGQSFNLEFAKTIFKKIYKKDIVLYLWSFLALILLSFSKFRLPQYIFWVIPPSVILISKWIIDYLNLRPELIKKSLLIQTLFLSTLFILFVIYSELFFTYGILVLFCFSLLLFFLRKELVLSLPLISVLLFYFYIITVVYPFLIHYQPAFQIRELLKQEEEFKELPLLYTHGIPLSHRSYSFYLEKIIRPFVLKKDGFYEFLTKNKFQYLIIDKNLYSAFKEEIQQKFKDVRIQILGQYPVYKVSKPKLKFFHPKARERYLHYVLVLKLEI